MAARDILDYIKKKYVILNMESISCNHNTGVYVYKSIEDDINIYVYKIFENKFNYWSEITIAKKIHLNPKFIGLVIDYVDIIENLPDELIRCVVIKYPFYEIISALDLYKMIALNAKNNNVVCRNVVCQNVVCRNVVCQNVVCRNVVDVDNVSNLLSNYLQKFIIKIIKIISSLHELGIYHLDIKSDNIVIIRKDNDYDIILLDFGTSHMIEKIIESDKTIYKLPYQDIHLYTHKVYKIIDQNDHTITAMSELMYNHIINTLNADYEHDHINGNLISSLDMNKIYHLPLDFFNVGAINDHAHYDIFNIDELHQISMAFEKIDSYSTGIYILDHLNSILLTEWHDISLKKTLINIILSLITRTPDTRTTISNINLI
jgi:serine/threonine protein kinase